MEQEQGDIGGGDSTDAGGLVETHRSNATQFLSSFTS